jgi:hypothetical protein
MTGQFIVLAVIWAACWCLCSGGNRTSAGPRYNLTHGSGHSMSHVRRHENGHRRVARALGCDGEVVITKDEAYFQITSARPLTPIEDAAISYGGRAAAGSGGHEQDDADAETILRQVPWSQRGAARAEARRIARRYAR